MFLNVCTWIKQIINIQSLLVLDKFLHDIYIIGK